MDVDTLWIISDVFNLYHTELILHLQGRHCST